MQESATQYKLTLILWDCNFITDVPAKFTSINLTINEEHQNN